ncbi:hypothetical protein ACFXPS_38015 [Nocardia sp. NPDC059091]|uniref:hypothetical protein n=1 Tax=unclassified Nocardia TaxID=2637762 RepID=UPI0036A948AA
MTRNQLSAVQSLAVVGFLLLILGVATFSLAYTAAAEVFGGLGIISMIGAAITWSTLKPPK